MDANRQATPGDVKSQEMGHFRGERGPPSYKTGTRHVRDRYEPRTSLGQDQATNIPEAYGRWTGLGVLAWRFRTVSGRARRPLAVDRR